MDTVELKNSGGKIVPHSDLRAGTNATKYSLKEKNKVRKRRIGTWNVRSLGICGKLENLKIEMERLKIDIIGISELKWTGKGDFWSEDYRIIFSGDDHRVTGVGFILNKEIGKKVVEVVQYNERIIAIKIETKPVDTFILQVYMQTSTHKDEEIEEIYEQINEVIEMTNEKTNLIVLGDWNAIVGESKEHGVAGAFGLGKRNERGHRLIEFCKERNLVITNTMFSQPIRRRYTWTMPGGRARYQIDYILVRNRYKNQVKKCKTYPGADINSDHNLVLMETNLSLKRKKPNECTKRKWCMDKLKNEEIRSDFNEELNNLLQEANSNKNQDNDKVEWEKLRDTMTKAAEKHLKFTKEMPTKPWINNEIIDLIEKRRKYKNAVSEEGIAEYKNYRNLVNREAKKAKEEWLNNICKDIDSCLTKGLSDKAYKNIKRFFREFKDKTTILRGTDGKIITEGKKKLEVWKQYIEKLYGNDNINAGQWVIEEEDAEQENIGQPILKGEFETALNELKHNKATGIDNISGEMLKALEGQGKEILFKIIYDAYEKGLVPKDFEKCLMIALPKKKKSEKCEDHRTISLIAHASKILTKIIHKRIEAKISVNLEEDQFGFRRNRGTREAILCLRMIMEKMYRVNKPMYIAFIDLEKAFDNVNWEILFNIMKTINIDIKD
ncbi:unnamed protein product [Macrosiphum euphorbiae]|nr:unnamed protein product [Macrosiphum euphorbiae]